MIELDAWSVEYESWGKIVVNLAHAAAWSGAPQKIKKQDGGEEAGYVIYLTGGWHFSVKQHPNFVKEEMAKMQRQALLTQGIRGVN